MSGTSLPPQFAPKVPDQDDITLCEACCRLVGTHHAARTNVSHLVYPAIEVDLTAVDSALAQHLPCLDVDDIGGGGQAAGGGADEQAPGWLRLPLALLTAGRRAVLSRLPGPWQVLQHQPPPPQLLAWSSSQPILAVGHTSSGAVLLYNCTAAAAAAAQAADGRPPALRHPHKVLVHQLQQQVSSIAWRPVHSSMLAVGCAGGVALWSLGQLPLSAAAMHRGNEGGGAAATAWATFLSFKAGCRVTSLCWAPDGTRLAASSCDTNRLMVWDVALGVGAKLRLGLVPVHLLAWSPDGNYLFAADRSGQFFLYETGTWTLRQWVSPAGSAVTGAAWAPDSNVLLLSMSGSTFLVALHIVGSPSRLTEQLLPVALPGVSDRELTDDLPGPLDPTSAAVRSPIISIRCDPKGNRLAVSLRPPHPAAGLVALYSTSFTPVVTCNLIGYVRASAAADVAGGWGEGEGSATEAEGQLTAGGSLLQAVFAPVPGKSEAAALLSIGLGGSAGELCRVANVPIYI